MGVPVLCRIHAEIYQELDLGLPRMWTQAAEFSGPILGRGGCSVSTAGWDEELSRAYIRNQEIAKKQLVQLQLRLASS
jgi:hypothetical protein